MPRRSGPADRADPSGRHEPGLVRVLAIADVPDEGLLASVSAVATAELILACGDLPFDYLGYLMNALDIPLVFVPGNHDPDLSGYRTSGAGLALRAGLPARPPWPSGAINADGRVVDVAGLRVAGLGGCLRYSGGPNQYSERQQARRAIGLRAAAWRRQRRDGRGIDVLLTHAPPLGIGDGTDLPHRGFSGYHRLVATIRPAVLLHGHVHPVVPVPSRGHISSQTATGQDALLGRTVVRNVAGRHLLDIEPAGAGPAEGPAPPGGHAPGGGPAPAGGHRDAR
jgi:hypothetical protein